MPYGKLAGNGGKSPWSAKSIVARELGLSCDSLSMACSWLEVKTLVGD